MFPRTYILVFECESPTVAAQLYSLHRFRFREKNRLHRGNVWVVKAFDRRDRICREIAHFLNTHDNTVTLYQMCTKAMLNITETAYLEGLS